MVLWNCKCQNSAHLSYSFWLCDLSGNWSRFNPLTPVLDVTGRDKRWSSCHFWRHHYRPKLISSILKVCRRKIYFQWYADQSDRLTGAWNMHENAEKFEWKTRSKISCDYTWLLHVKKLAVSMMLSQKFLNWKQVQWKVNHCSKNITKEEEE